MITVAARMMTGVVADHAQQSLQRPLSLRGKFEYLRNPNTSLVLFKCFIRKFNGSAGSPLPTCNLCTAFQLNKQTNPTGVRQRFRQPIITGFQLVKCIFKKLSIQNLAVKMSGNNQGCPDRSTADNYRPIFTHNSLIGALYKGSSGEPIR